MTIDQLKRQWQEKAILDIRASMQHCAACLRADSALATDLLLLRSQYEQSAKDFLQQTITLGQRDVQWAKVRLGFQQLTQQALASDVLSEVMNEQSPDLEPATTTAFVPPEQSLPLAEYTQSIHQNINQLRSREQALLHQFADAAIPTGEWLQQVGVKIQEQQLKNGEEDQFMQVLNIFLDKGADKLGVLNQTLFQSYPGFDQLYHDHDLLTTALIEYGEQQMGNEPLALVQQHIPLLLAFADRANQFTEELAGFKNMKMLAAISMFNSGFHETLTRSLELIEKIHQITTAFVMQMDRRRVELDLAFS